MPIYEYVCEECGRLTELMQRMNDPAPTACPECGAAKLARLVSRTSFQLKGGGWYSDLYASAKKKPDSATPPADAAKGSPAAAPGGPTASASPTASPASASSGAGAGAGGSTAGPAKAE